MFSGQLAHPKIGAVQMAQSGLGLSLRIHARWRFDPQNWLLTRIKKYRGAKIRISEFGRISLGATIEVSIVDGIIAVNKKTVGAWAKRLGRDGVRGKSGLVYDLGWWRNPSLSGLRRRLPHEHIEALLHFLQLRFHVHETGIGQPLVDRVKRKSIPDGESNMVWRNYSGEEVW